jgi:acetyl esterase/lipase
MDDYPPELRALTAVPDDAYQIVHYGPDPDQFGQLWMPADATGPLPVVVLIHGGYWRARYRLDLMHALAADLVARGHAVWNIEYRRVGSVGGGWPGTFLDVAAAIDALAELGTGPDLSRVTVIGHSAGGHLALWAAGRSRSASADPPELSRPPRVVPTLVVSLAGVCDLAEAARLRLSDGAVFGLLGGTPEEHPDRYRLACPARMLPLGVAQIAVHGTEDSAVPLAISTGYAAAAGPECELLVLPGVDHFALIDPASDAWAAVAARLPCR